MSDGSLKVIDGQSGAFKISKGQSRSKLTFFDRAPFQVGLCESEIGQLFVVSNDFSGKLRALYDLKIIASSSVSIAY